MRNLIFLLLFTLSLTACQTTTMPWDRNKGNELPPVELLNGDESTSVAPIDDGTPMAGKSRFGDVPVPVGVREDMDRTYVFESSSLQIGRLVYYTKTPVVDLAKFYMRECKNEGWTLDSVLQAEGANLLFRKPGRRLDVMARSQGVGRSTLLIVSLTPED